MPRSQAPQWGRLLLLVCCALTEVECKEVIANGTEFLAALTGAAALPLNLVLSKANVSESITLTSNTTSYWDTGQLSITGVSPDGHQRPILDLDDRSEVSVGDTFEESKRAPCGVVWTAVEKFWTGSAPSCKPHRSLPHAAFIQWFVFGTG